MEKSRERCLSEQRHRLCLVGKRGGAEAGPSTPPPPWRLEMSADGGNSNSAKQFLTSPLNNSAVSARKLCAILWETHPQNVPSPSRTRKGAPKPLSKVKIDAGFDFDHSDVEPHRVSPYRPPGNPVSSLNGPSKVTQKEKLLVKELKEEKKLREYSEMKLCKEISGLKAGFSTMMKGLEKEKKARFLLENLCDEFARGVRDYDSELRLANHKLGEDTLCGESHDHSILHISESWLDERMQMKQTDSGREKDMIVDRLSPEIETFLRAKRSGKNKELNGNCFRRHSLESFALNEGADAPVFADEHSLGSDFHSQERKGTSKQEVGNSSSVEAKVVHRTGPFRSLSLKGDRVSYVGGTAREVSRHLQLEGVKENTLLAKLLEARLESRQSRSRASRRRSL